MNLEALRTSLREELLDDVAEPYLWSDDTLNRYLNNAVREACIRARALHDDAVSNPAFCSIAVQPGTSRVQFDKSIIAIRSASLSDASRTLRCVSSHDMDVREPGWDAGRQEIGDPFYLVMDLDQKRVQLWPTPGRPIVLQLRVWRMPTGDEVMQNDEDEPAIILPDPEELRHWAAYEAYLKRDADANNEQAASSHLALFEQRFGARPTLEDMVRWADSPPRIRNAHMF